VQGDLLHNFSQSSFGGIACAQYNIDFILWENVLNDNPGMVGIMEIGTWQGGFSLFLDAQARARNMTFVTYDVAEPDRPIPGFVKRDVWAEVEQVKEDAFAMGEGMPIVLFCDGGNKPRELKTFPPLMPDGSIFLVHDWGTETTADDVPDSLQELYGGWCDTVGSVTRVFRMKHGS
jgi:hypothetical protein